MLASDAEMGHMKQVKSSRGWGLCDNIITSVRCSSEIHKLYRIFLIFLKISITLALILSAEKIRLDCSFISSLIPSCQLCKKVEMFSLVL